MDFPMRFIFLCFTSKEVWDSTRANQICVSMSLSMEGKSVWERHDSCFGLTLQNRDLNFRLKNPGY
jgi:hypothetical protein